MHCGISIRPNDRSGSFASITLRTRVRLSPEIQTCQAAVRFVAICQNQTHASQQTGAYSIDSSTRSSFANDFLAVAEELSFLRGKLPECLRDLRHWLNDGT